MHSASPRSHASALNKQRYVLYDNISGGASFQLRGGVLNPLLDGVQDGHVAAKRFRSAFVDEFLGFRDGFRVGSRSETVLPLVVAREETALHTLLKVVHFLLHNMLHFVHAIGTRLHARLERLPLQRHVVKAFGHAHIRTLGQRSETQACYKCQADNEPFAAVEDAPGRVS